MAGIILPILEKTFKQLERFSLLSLFTSVRLRNKDTSNKDLVQLSLTRTKIVDLYVLFWLFAEGIIILLIAFDLCPKWMIILSVYRLVDIMQSTFNMQLFDHIRSSGKHYTHSLTRTFILSIINYIEVGICFGIIYYCFNNLLTNYNSWEDCFYFSYITQLTVGYGDILPTKFLKFVSLLQAFYGFVLGIVALSKLIGILPNIEEIDKLKDK